MTAPIQPNAIAWQPLTPRGVAAFAFATCRRLLLVQFLVALAAAGTIAWILAQHWVPVIRTAIGELPEQGRIANGRLEWPGKPSQLLAESSFLAVSVDLNHSGATRSPAHLEIEFGRSELQLHSLLGYYAPFPYPQSVDVPFNRPSLEPWWGAWSPVFVGLIAFASVAALLLSWTLLATIYTPIVWLVALYGNRELSLRRSWKLAGAALMPGALWEIGILAGYSLGRLDLVPFLAATSAHVVIGWLFLLLSPWSLARAASSNVNRGNPFVADRPARMDRN